jgi:glycosyltransferase involved in cell wall biosynthesis
MKLAFVIPWYGKDVTGGAENAARETVQALQRLADLEVEVLTTCIQDFRSDWNVNSRPEGLEWVNDIPVRRFPVRPRDTNAFDAVNARLMNDLFVTAEQEAIFMQEMIHSPALYDFIHTYIDDYVFFFIPYMFGTTYAGSVIHADRSILIPCLHDESYAYLSCYREMFRRVRGVAFLSHAERDLAHRLYDMRPDAPAVVRVGINTDFEAHADRFISKYGIKDFVLYVGRKEMGKNVPLLVEYFGQYKCRYGGNLKLVLVGPGAVEIPADYRQDIIDLGFLSEQDKCDAYAAALTLCQPSLNESFSIAMMEAWVVETPVLVHAHCAVTKEHCLEANGGLYFADFEEFVGCLRRLQHDAGLRDRLGRQGRRYVLRHFTWEAVVANYLAALEQWGFPVESRPPKSALPQPLQAEYARLADLAEPPASTPRPGANIVGLNVESCIPAMAVSEVHQLVASFRRGDAIGNATIALRDTLSAWGYKSEVFTYHRDSMSRDQVRRSTEFEQRCPPGQVLIYHYGIHSEVSELFLQYRGKKILLYHNITPAHFFDGYSNLHVQLINLGRAQLPNLVQASDLCLGDSRYNCIELEQYGARDCRVLPILMDLDSMSQITPDPTVLRCFGDTRPTIIFVGRPVPNKRQDDIIRVFAHYRHTFAANARLVLVGGSDETNQYEEELHQLVQTLGLDGDVTFTGHVSDQQLIAYYRAADAFLSMSEHEGFGVPLLEAMYFDIPVIAYAAAAVPYTMGRAGIVMREKNIVQIAERLHHVMEDRDFRAEILAGQRRRLRDFAPSKVQAMLRLYLDELLAS